MPNGSSGFFVILRLGMSDSADGSKDQQRCVRCDTLNDAERQRCLGCGFRLSDDAKPQEKPAVAEPSVAKLSIDFTSAQPQSPPVPSLFEKVFPVVALFLAALALWLGVDIQRQRQALAFAEPSPTAILTAVPTLTPRPSLTPFPIATNTLVPTATPLPTETPTPIPTPTLEPPYTHTIAEGEALFNIALRYRVSVDSIVAVNEGLSPERIVSGTSIDVPRPTATPPLVPIEVDVNGETLVADPTDCVMHEIQEADTYFGIAGRYEVPLDALIGMNRLSAESILSPGDRVCIPTITFSVSAFADGEVPELGDYGKNIIQPRLLYPPTNATVADASVTLQWIAERDLAANEWYMVEVTNLSDTASRPFRAFVQQTSFQLPDSLQAADSTYRWRVSFVYVTAERGDGDFIYSFGGPSSEALFLTD